MITNRDRHQNNIGFLRNSETKKIVSVAPIFDSGSSVEMEGKAPEGVKDTVVNGLYHTERELLEHVSDFSLVNVEELPTLAEVKSILNECKYTSDARKNTLLSLYVLKVSCLKKLQSLALENPELSSKEIVDMVFDSVEQSKEDDLYKER